MGQKLKPVEKSPLSISVHYQRYDEDGNESESGKFGSTSVEFSVTGIDTISCDFDGIKTEEEIDKALEKIRKPLYNYLLEELTGLFTDALETEQE